MRKIISICSFMFIAFLCHAQDFWLPIEKPNTKTVNSLQTVGKDELYVGMAATGVFRSTNEGINWTLFGLSNISVYSLLIHENEIIYAGTGGFTQLHSRVLSDTVWHVLYGDSYNITCIFHSDDGCLHFSTWNNIYKSCDNGLSWTNTLNLSGVTLIKNIIKTQDGVMYAAIKSVYGGGGVYRSLDNGDSWHYLALVNYYIKDVNIDSEGALYAGSVGENGIGVYKSVDNGASWWGIKNNVFVERIIITPDDVIYIGCSNEHGTQGGVFRSTDGGMNWEMLNSGLDTYQEQCVYGLTLSPDGYLYAYGFTIHRSAEKVFDPIYTISADVVPEDAAMITGEGTYEFGESIQLEAIPSQGYTFVNWTENNKEVSSQQIYEFTVNRHRSLKAHLMYDASRITLIASPAQAGTVSGGGVFPNGTLVEVHAHAHEGYSFLRWEENGVIVSTDSVYSFVLEGNRNLEAVFSKNIYTLWLLALPQEGGEVSGAGEYEHGTVVEVQAIAQEGYSFLHWTENAEVVSIEAHYSFPLTENRSLTAHFNLNTYTLSLEANPAQGGYATGEGEYEHGTVVEVQAIAHEGYSFVHWTENAEVVSTEAHYSFPLTENRSLTAHFNLNTYTLSLAANPAEGGYTTGAGEYEHGTVVEVQAIAHEGYSFANWTENGEVISTDSIFSITITHQAYLFANFNKETGLEKHHGSPSMRIFPNPFQTSFSLEVHAITGNQYPLEITLINTAGLKVYKEVFADTSSVTIHLPGLPAGFYILYVCSNGRLSSHRIGKW